MPKLSLYRPNKQNDFRYLDKIISEQFTVGGTDLYIHKYLGPVNQGPSVDHTQPEYLTPDPTKIQDLLFLENRDRKYDPNIFRLRGHYNVQNLDFDLSQFGLFLNNDIIFITVHYNDMIDIIGRKLMVGDVLELPHLLDYNPLNETIPIALKRFYQITDANYASEGFSQTWFPHLWRIKCEPLVDSQEFNQVLVEPVNKDNYLGTWDATKTYLQGYVITFGDKNYIAKQDVPVGLMPPDSTYWELDSNNTLKDILSTYNKNIAINDAALNEAKRLVEKSGYNNQNLYVIPTYDLYEQTGIFSRKVNQPAPPENILVNSASGPQTATGTVQLIRNPNYKNASPVISIPKSTVESIWDLTADLDGTQLTKFVQTSLEISEYAPQLTDTGSGSVESIKFLSAQPLSDNITGPYGTSDNMYATSDQDPTLPGFSGDVSQISNYRADNDPRFQYITRSTPRSFGYAAGYLTGDGSAPNGLPTGAGISFPHGPQVGDYFLRIDYLPQLLFRWDGTMWVKISENVRTETGLQGTGDLSQLSSFINNSNVTVLTNGTTVKQSQPLSTILTQPLDPLPPIA